MTTAKTTARHGEVATITAHAAGTWSATEEEGWDALAARTPLPTGTAAWIDACLEGFHREDPVEAVCVRRDGALVAATALVRTAEGSLHHPGIDPLYEPTDLLAADAAARSALARIVVTLRRPVVLARVEAHGGTVEALRLAARRRGVTTARPAPGAPRLVLEAGEDPLTRMSSRRRSDLRRARRRAEVLGEVRVTHHAPSVGELGPLLDIAERVEAAGWKGRAGTAIAVGGGQRTAVRAFARSMAATGRLRIALLHVGDAVAAMQIGVEHARAYWILKVGYDEEFARCSPGLLLLAETIADSARRGDASFELQGCAERWTAAFTSLERETCCVRVYPARAAGVARLLDDSSRRLQRRLRGPRERLT